MSFWESNSNYQDARASLEAWYQEAKQAKWFGPTDIRAKYCNASILKGGRVIFNIAGKRSLTLSMMRSLHQNLGIPAEVLLQAQEATLPEL
ncbi:type II toxin-antitoxin system HigB family toxin [Gloeocapsa sp. PCC 73106]|uniref:type II toxin-antitoxin system HigB family toxin n=1 Tax=Gloeocapsa sp. PCC 73106 TaxID=102232 RepID=UPI00156672D2